MQNNITLPGVRLGGLSPISIGLIIAGGLFFVIVVVVRATILQPSDIDTATAAGAASIQLPLQNNVAGALPAFVLAPTVAPTPAGEGSTAPGMRSPVYLMEATPVAVPTVTPTVIPTVAPIVAAPPTPSATIYSGEKLIAWGGLLYRCARLTTSLQWAGPDEPERAAWEALDAGSKQSVVNMCLGG